VRPDAVQIPTRAVLQGPQGKFVYVVADGKAQPRPVEVGDQLAEGWIITKGLSPGDPVIVDGMARIFFPGAPVRLAQADTSAASGAAHAHADPGARPEAGHSDADSRVTPEAGPIEARHTEARHTEAPMASSR
jgi:membrane fusion protein (multidrug efflux system)